MDHYQLGSSRRGRCALLSHAPFAHSCPPQFTKPPHYTAEEVAQSSWLLHVGPNASEVVLLVGRRRHDVDGHADARVDLTPLGRRSTLD